MVGQPANLHEAAARGNVEAIHDHFKHGGDVNVRGPAGEPL